MNKALCTAFLLLVGGALSAAANGQQASVTFKHFESIKEARAWPKSLRARAMAAMTTEEFNESESITPILRQEYLDNLKDAYFAYSANINALPVGLRRFVGFSVQDLFNNNNCPEIEVCQDSNLRWLFLGFKRLYDLNGLHNIPEIETVQVLDVSNNKLTVLPEGVCELTALRQLRVSDNKLTVLSETIGKLIALKYLWVSDNKLKSLPQAIGNLIALQVLVVCGNKLTALPETIDKLTALQVLDVSGNKLTALREGICEFTALQRLDVSNNKLTALPEGICELTVLQKLDVSSNKLMALPEAIGNLTASLRSFDVQRNKLMALPETIGKLTALQVLDVSGNHLSKQEIASLREKFKGRPAHLFIGNQSPELADVAVQAASSQ